MEPGELIASRYRVREPLTVDGTASGFLGTDERTQAEVVLIPLDAAEAQALRPAVGVDHAHLGRVLEILEPEPGKFLLAAERVVGPALEDVLVEIERETPTEAVRSTLRVADAVAAVHQAGGVHGFISPASLVVAPEGHAPPRLGFFPVRPTSSYRSPDRGSSGPPSVSDDAWAVTCLLYEMLVGKRPPAEGVESIESLEQLGVMDPALSSMLLHGLNRDSSQRARDTTELLRELARWFVDHATTDAAAAGVHGSNPPPLPASRPPGAPVGTRGRRSLGKIPLLAGAAILIGLGAAWAGSAFRSKRVVEVPVEPSAGATAALAESGQSIDLSEVPVTGQKEAATGNKMATCVAGYLPKGTFGETTPDFAWICSERDPREGGTKLRATVVAAKPKDQLTEAMKIFGRIGWYEMAAYALVYRSCCADAPPLVLPEPAAGCPKLDEALNLLGRDAISERGPDEPLKAMRAAIECEIKANHTNVYRRPGKTAAAEEEAFRDLLKPMQTP